MIDVKENKILFAKALSEGFSRKIASDIASVDNNISFSESHNLKMSEIFASDKRIIDNQRSSRVDIKRLIAAVLIAVIVLSMVACGIYIFREEIAGFFVQSDDIWSVLTMPENAQKSLETKYYTTYIPDGFEIMTEIEDSTGITLQYSCGEDLYISYIQSTPLAFVAWVDNERSERNTMMLDDIKILYYVHENGSVSYFWVRDDYVFFLGLPKELVESDEFELIFEGIKEK